MVLPVLLRFLIYFEYTFMAKIFDKGNIIICTIEESDLMAFLTPLDIDDAGNAIYPYNQIGELIMNTLPEYAFADYLDHLSIQEAMSIVRESAKSMYETNSYHAINKYYIEHDPAYEKVAKEQRAISRGEFGEILLHLLLRDFKHTIPLVSKMYFKDSRGVPAHGFDAVHITPDDKILWLGESKLYKSGASALKELVDDLKKHFTHDFLEQEYSLIKKHVRVNGIPDRDYWIEEMTKRKKLKDMIVGVNVPMLCLYEDANYKKCITKAIDDIAPVFETRLRKLKKEFDEVNDAPLKDRLNVILFLFPVLDKEEFVLKLHERLYHLQKS